MYTYLISSSLHNPFQTVIYSEKLFKNYVFFLCIVLITFWPTLIYANYKSAKRSLKKLNAFRKARKTLMDHMKIFVPSAARKKKKKTRAFSIRCQVGRQTEHHFKCWMGELKKWANAVFIVGEKENVIFFFAIS